MRKAEIVNLSTSRVDLREGFIRLKPEDTKTGYGRLIPIHPELMEVFKKALKVRPLKSNRVFHRNGKPISPEQIRWAHRSVAGMEDREFHFSRFPAYLH